MRYRSSSSNCETGSTVIWSRTVTTPLTFATRFSMSLRLNGIVTLPVSVTTPSFTLALTSSKIVKRV